jgi:peptidoglycan/LPS O-acetylase OafA/YrhL
MWILGAMILGWVLYARFVRQVYELERVASISVYELYLLSPLVLEFFAGALLACFLIRNPAGRSWAWLLLGLLLFFVGGWLYRLRFIGLLELGFFNLWRPMVFGMGSVLIVAGLVQLERRGFRAPLQLSLLGGGASYALYLCHTQWLYISNRFGFGEWLSGGPPWLVQLAFLGLVFLIVVYSVLHWRWVERPLHRLFRRLLRA